ncbi:hypothetical protein [Engelhardtia mirabilis]|uniref:DUF4142 domain-containing protein n=1 Tax=Engelhardtia mirabilis TaxID=2528011 RepID=A0A518BFT1_9BACT|nr:hypothetical protein Pla133_08390 [Planctomycetes bacterium Pla133]QDV00099.1 hypothetical protein Pla86_08380 [Planctomycetes bacterium Pla86]
MNHRQKLYATAAIALLASGCAATHREVPAPDLVIAPTPLEGAAGEFLSPYNRSGELAPWAMVAIETGLASEVEDDLELEQRGVIDSTVRAFSRTFGDDPRINEAVVEAAGGWDEIRAGTDQSFVEAVDLSTFLYANYSLDPDYRSALAVVFDLFPEVRSTYAGAVRRAATQSAAPAVGSSGP